MTRRALFLLVALVVAGCRGPAPFTLTAALVDANNRAVGLMGQFDYDAAVAAFSALAADAPAWPEATLNLGIARMNRQSAGDPAAAETLFRGLLATPAVARRARYNLGLLLLHEGRETEAAPFLQAVADDADAPDGDGHAAYFVGQLRLTGAPGDALTWYDRAVSRAPLLRSAHYGRFLALQRLGRAEEATAALARFQALATHPQAGVAEFKYTRMGPLSLAVTVDLPAPAAPAATPAAARGPAFAAPVALPGTDGLPWRDTAPGASITSADINGDGRQDLFLPGALAGAAPNAVLLRQGDVYAHAPGHPLAAAAGVATAFWGDLDDDGLLDAALGGPSGVQFWRQAPAGQWADVTARTGLRPADTRTSVADGALFDADHDGDLDLWLVSRDGPTRLLTNTSGFRFRDIARDAGLAGDGRPSLGIAVADLDADRDTDVMVIKASPPHDIFLNDRVWRYHRDGQASALAAASFLALLPADLDADGVPELYTTGTRGLERWMRGTDGTWSPAVIRAAAGPAPSTTGTSPDSTPTALAVADIDGNGAFELLVADPRGWSAYATSPSPSRPGSSPLAPATLHVATAGTPASTTAAPLFASVDSTLRAWAVLHDGDARGPSVIARGPAGAPRIWAPGTGRQRYATLIFTGHDPKSDQRRSNRSGLGSRVAVRTGSRWAAFETTRLASGPGQSAQPIDVGLGDAPRADFVAVTWSDGVFQTELGLAAGQRHLVAETQRQLSSCPVLFAWDGTRTRFVTDLLGVGGIGFFERPGVYSEPLPREQVLLPTEAIAPREGRYTLVIGEPMEEVTYLDEARLVAYDLPPGWQMVLDERRAIRSVAPTGRPIFFRDERLPVHAQMDDGRDVSAAVRTVDLVAAGPAAIDPHFIGRALPHAVTVEFDRPLDDGTGRAVLMADGWLEYPYAQTVFAAWQAGVTYDAPTLEARDGQGRWHVIAPEFGYPAGMPRRMALPLPTLPRGTTALRLRTTQEIYWDRLAVVYDEPLPQARTSVLPLETATLTAGGFARRTTGPQRAPFYDYDQRLPLDDTRHQRGWYTAFGDVRPLVDTHDDAVAIFGPGEEIQLAFRAPEAAPPPGWTRRVVLDARGWCKDMDLYTRDGETIAPLPGRDTPARQQLHARFNTRYASGH